MSHYVCTGDCQTVSDVPGVCNADYCGKNGQAMTICGCEDNEHEEVTTEKESGGDEEQE